MAAMIVDFITRSFARMRSAVHSKRDVSGMITLHIPIGVHSEVVERAHAWLIYLWGGHGGFKSNHGGLKQAVRFGITIVNGAGIGTKSTSTCGEAFAVGSRQ